MTPRERLDAIEARAAATVEFPGEATVHVRVLNTYEIVTRDVPALVAFARAVLDAADEARVDGAPRVLARVFVWGTLDRIADKYLGGES